MPGKRAVIFDLDGTLLDTLTDIANSMNNVLDRFGYPPHERDTYLSFVGDGIDVLAIRALPDDKRDEATVSEVVSSMREEYTKRWSETSRPFPGVAELLDDLTERGMLLAVLSNKLDSFTKIMVNSLLGQWKFFQVRGLEFDKTRKPDPRQALEIAQDMHLEPERIVFVGDSDIDIQTAKRAGMVPVGVLWGYQSREKLITSGAEILISQPMDLVAHIL